MNEKNKNKKRTGNARTRNRRNKIRPLKKRAVKQITNELARLDVGGINTSSGYTNPLQFRRLQTSGLLSEMQSYHKHMRDRYLAGVIHPDLAVKNNIQLKAYSDFPIPTSSIGWHTQTTYTPNATGNFLISWRPNCFLTASDFPMSNVTFNNNVALTGNAAVGGNAFVAAASVNYVSAVSIQRYRLVSAMIKVSYNGSVLNQSGTMISCCTQDPFVVGNTTAACSDSLVDRFGNFSLINNGLWNNTINITKDSEGLECLYVPMDPEDMIFDRTGYYLGSVFSATAGGVTSPAPVGAPINYVIAGRNFPTVACIVVDIYANYEVVPDPASAPILRSSVEDSLTKSDSDNHLASLKTFAKDGGLIRPVTSFNWKDALFDVAKVGVNYLPKLLSML